MPKTSPFAEEKRVPIHNNDYVVLAYQTARTMAMQVGFSDVEQAGLCIAVLEVARNILQYAKKGEVILRRLQRPADKRWGMMVIAHDDGPGITDIDKAIQDGYSTGGSLGLGLPGAKRLVDEFEIVSHPGKGTTITMKKWKQ